MDEDEVSQAKKEIRSVLITFPRGVSLFEFKKTYKKLTGEDFSADKFGFDSVIDFLFSIPDIVHIYIDKEGHYKLFGIADDSIKHIQKLVQSQKIPTSDSKLKRFHLTNNNTSRNIPFISATLRLEINHIMKAFPSGISFPSFFLAFKKVFKRSLILENGLETLEQIISVLPELQIKVINNEKRIYLTYIDMSEKEDSNSCVKKKSNIDTFEASYAFGNESNGEKHLLPLSEHTIDKSGISNADKQKLAKVFKLYPEGILAVYFPPLYEKVTGEAFELCKLGFNSVLELADSLPDVFVRKLVPGSERDWILLPALLHDCPINEELHSEYFPHINGRCIHNVKKLLKHYSPDGIKISDFFHLYQIYFNDSLPVNNDNDNTVACFLELLSEWIPLKFKIRESTKFVYWPTGQLGDEVKRHFSKLSDKKGISDDVANPTHPYIQPQLPADLNLSEYVPVFISSVLNPSLFWFQLQTDEAKHNLRKLEEELDLFYDHSVEQGYEMSDADVMIGTTCVACCPTDRQWYRVAIRSVPSSNSVNVFHVDYGGSSNIPRSNLRYAKKSFLDIPAFAFEASLACLKPSNHESDWSTKGQKRFIQLCKTAKMMAQIKVIENGTTSIFLCDTNEDEDIHINDILIHEGYAEFCLDDVSFGQRSHLSEVNFDSDSLKTDYLINTSFCSSFTSPGSSACSDIEYFEDTPKNVSNYSYEEGFPLSEASSSDTQSSEEGSVQLKRNKTASPMPKRLFCDSLQQKTFETNDIGKRRYLKRLKLGDGYVSHIIVVNNKPFVSCGDISSLLWGDSEALSCRLKFKEAVFPTETVLSDNFKSLFEQCQRYSVKGIQETSSSTLSLTLYPLDCVISVLNIFGHPSVLVRQAFDKEAKTFDPFDPVWNDFSSDDALDDTTEDINSPADKLMKLCLYDLKAMHEGLNCKKLKILSHLDGKSNAVDMEIEKIEKFQSIISRRMKYIEALSSSYS